MRRHDREQSLEFSLALIDKAPHGIAAFSTPDGAPYCIPLSFVRIGEFLYFHCAMEGYKVDLLRADPRVCVTFVGEDSPAFLEPSMYTTYFQSAVVCGTAREVTEPEEKTEALRALCEKLLPAHMGQAFERAIDQSLSVTMIWKISMDQVTGKAKRRPN